MGSTIHTFGTGRIQSLRVVWKSNVHDDVTNFYCTLHASTILTVVVSVCLTGYGPTGGAYNRHFPLMSTNFLAISTILGYCSMQKYYPNHAIFHSGSQKIVRGKPLP